MPDDDQENDLIKQAIADTESEIFGDATGANPDHTDDTGDRTVEEMGTGLEGQHDEEDADTEVEASGEGGDDAGDGKEGTEGGDHAADTTRDPKTGQFTKKAEDGKGEGTETETEVAEEGDQGAAQSREQSNKRVPISEMLTERKGRQAAERRVTELETAATQTNTQMQSLSQRLDQLSVAIASGKNVVNGQVQPQQGQNQTTEPSLEDLLIENPAKFVETVEARVENKLRNERVQHTMQAAHVKYKGDFEQAFAAMTALDKADPAARLIAQRIRTAYDPGEELVKWHKGVKQVEALGSETLEERDARIIKEHNEKLASDEGYRKQHLGDGTKKPLQQGTQQPARDNNGNPTRTVVRLPKSLNSAAGGQNGGHSAYNSGSTDRDVFNDALRP